MDHDQVRRFAARVLAAGTCAALLAGLCGPTKAAWDGVQQIDLGDTVSSEIVGTEMHQFDFFAPADTIVGATLKVAKGDSLEPHLVVTDLFGNVLASGSPQGRSIRMKGESIQNAGWYHIAVNAAGGTGLYTLKTKGKIPKRMKPSVSLDGDGGTWEFGAVAGTKLSASVRSAKGSAATPTITGLVGPGGPIAVTPGTKIKNVFLTETGMFTLEIANAGAAGDVSLVVSSNAPGSRRTWGFGPIEVPNGAVAQVAAAWSQSAHGNATAEAFRHWDGSGAVSGSCARCHSGAGFVAAIDTFDPTAATPSYGSASAPTNTVIDCNACHDAKALALDAVKFPSGALVQGLGAEARCMTCHQGRESTVSLDARIANANPTGDDAVTAGLSFANVHYFAAGATLFGSKAKGGYEYAGKTYDTRNPHVDLYRACQDCHDPHTLQVRTAECEQCHPGVAQSTDALHDIRMAGSVRDYDGNAQIEGMYHEIEGLGASLYAAIQAYAQANGAPIVYDVSSHPYFFDAAGSAYASWTPRLLRAAYNYQYFHKDPGAYAHNPHYVIELLYDSIADLNTFAGVTTPNLASMWRTDTGHFDATSEAYRHWDGDNAALGRDGEVRSSCALCHSPGGFDFNAEFGIAPTTSFPISDGLECETCHVGGDFGASKPALKYIGAVEFPSGVVIANDPADPDPSFVCMTCHKGRESMASVDAAIAGGSPTFKNVHYLPAGATLYGRDAAVGYMYKDPSSYAPEWTHRDQTNFGASADCTFCHLEDHTFRPQMTSACTLCHAGVADIAHIRTNRPSDYDGDGNVTEPLADELKSLGDRLLASIRAWAAANTAHGIAYDVSSHPYWFQDDNGDGLPDVDGTGAAIRFNSWDAALSKATFNYQLWRKEPGAWAHNTDFTAQVLYDAIDDLGGSLFGTAGAFDVPGRPLP